MHTYKSDIHVTPLLKILATGLIRLCCNCVLILIMSCGVSLTCTDLKTFLKHAQQELQRVFNTACGFSNAQEVVHRQKAAMRTKVNVLRMHAHSLCNGRGKLTDSHIAGTCHSTFTVVTRQASRKGGGGSRGFTQTPLLTSKRFYEHLLTVHFKCPTIWKWFTSFVAIENHHCSNKSGCSYASLFMEDQRGMHM